MALRTRLLQRELGPVSDYRQRLSDMTDDELSSEWVRVMNRPGFRRGLVY